MNSFSFVSYAKCNVCRQWNCTEWMPYGDVYMHFLQKIRFSVSFSCSRTELYGTDSTEEWCKTTTLYGKLDQHNKWRSDSHLNQRVAGGFIGEECDYRRITWGGSLIGVTGVQMQSWPGWPGHHTEGGGNQQQSLRHADLLQGLASRLQHNSIEGIHCLIIILSQPTLICSFGS